MNENVWIMDAERRHEQIAATMRQARGPSVRGRVARPVGPGPLLGIVVLGMVLELPAIPLVAGVGAVVVLREATRRWRMARGHAGGRRKGVPAWSSAFISR